MSAQALANVTAVAIGGRVVLIEGPPGSGKSSLALALIDRGAVLVGDDAVTLETPDRQLHASPPPNTAGMLEVRNVGLVELPATSGPVALVLALDPDAPRFPLRIAAREFGDVAIPLLPFAPGDPVQALRAEMALAQHGLAIGAGGSDGEAQAHGWL